MPQPPRYKKPREKRTPAPPAPPRRKEQQPGLPPARPGLPTPRKPAVAWGVGGRGGPGMTPTTPPGRRPAQPKPDWRYKAEDEGLSAPSLTASAPPPSGWGWGVSRQTGRLIPPPTKQGPTPKGRGGGRGGEIVGGYWIERGPGLHVGRATPIAARNAARLAQRLKKKGK